MGTDYLRSRAAQVPHRHTDAPVLERRSSEETAQKIDHAVRELVEKAFERALSVLKEKRAILEKGAKELLQKETLVADDLARLIGQTARHRCAAADSPASSSPSGASTAR
jgi:ATP-dependent Zn protease